MDDEDETVVMGDNGNRCIVECELGATTGRVLASGNGEGHHSFQLSSSTDVTADKVRDSLSVIDGMNPRAIGWSLRSGAVNGETIIDNITGYGLTVDSERFIYVTNVTHNEVIRFRRGERGMETSWSVEIGNEMNRNSLMVPSV